MHSLINGTKIGMRFFLFSGLFIFLNSCSSSMSPTQVNDTLPSLTNSKYLTRAQAVEVMESNRCQYIVKGREYTAPIGLTTKKDLKNGARGIDEWVELDGANAYVLTGYKWVTVDVSGSTQLQVEFDTVLCE